jgi:hypothetical protein
MLVCLFLDSLAMGKDQEENSQSPKHDWIFLDNSIQCRCRHHHLHILVPLCYTIEELTLILMQKITAASVVWLLITSFHCANSCPISKLSSTSVLLFLQFNVHADKEWKGWESDLSSQRLSSFSNPFESATLSWMKIYSNEFYPNFVNKQETWGFETTIWHRLSNHITENMWTICNVRIIVWMVCCLWQKNLHSSFVLK